MLSDNIKNLRKAKGLSQEELAIKLNVVRQTVSKWEKGLSVPDSEMLIKIAEVLETSITVLLGETIDPDDDSEMKAIAHKLAIVNEQIAKHNEHRRKNLATVLGIVFVVSTCVALRGLISAIHLYIAMNGINQSAVVRVGYDGPIGVIVLRMVSLFMPFIFSLVVAVASFVGIYKIRKK